MREIVSVIRMNSTDGLRRAAQATIDNEASFYDNHGFSRGTSVSSKKSINRSQAELQIDPSHFDEIEVDEDSFRSDLERDSIHSSMDNYAATKSFDRQMSHQERYARLQRQSQRRTSERRNSNSRPNPRYPVLNPSDISDGQETRPASQISRPKKPPPPPVMERDEKPEPSIANLFGVIDTRKLRSLWSVELEDRSSKYIYSGSQLDPIPEASAPPIEEVECEQMYDSRRVNAPTLDNNPYKTGYALFYGSIASFVSGVLLLMSFASPYWLQSWEDTQSPFKNMGLWEFCFYKFRHPDYQFDHLFHGCHALYGDEYRLIREKLLPGWLMVVQLFVTLALISSFLGQIVIVCLLLRTPLEWILRFEWHFCGISLVCKGITATLLFLSICIFGGCCWARDWLLYPNYNYVSWSYAFAVFSTLGHIIASVFMYFDCQQAKERKEKNKALIMQMHGVSSTTSSYQFGGSGYI